MSVADFYLELVSWGKVKGCVDELFRVSWDHFRSRVWVPYLFLIIYIQVTFEKREARRGF